LGKTVVIIGSAHPLRGGLAAYNERLAREFNRHGDQAVIETFSLQYPSFLFPGKTQYADWPAPSDILIHISVNSSNPFNWIAVGRRIKKLRPELVIIKYWLPFMGPCFGTIARIIRRNRYTRIISILDNLFPHEKRPGDRLFTRYFVKPIDGFVAMSKSVEADIEQFEPAKKRGFCPHPLFDNFGKALAQKEAILQLHLDPSYRYLLFFGFIRDYKGLDLALKAIADPRLQNYPVKLVVAGEFYSDPAPYHKLIAELGIADRVILKTEFIPDSQVAPYFCACDMVVQPYKSATQSGVTQIAYHFDKSMLVTNVGGLPEIVPHGRVGYVVEPEPGAITEALLDFYRQDRAQEFTRNTRIEKENYSWERMVKTIDEMYHSLIQP
jgi:D-inositol-3-phosphate glycosyltransferase